MDVQEIRDPEAARRYVLDGLSMCRTAAFDGDLARRALPWALEIAGAGDPLPPLGFVADVGNIALGAEIEPARRDGLPIAEGFDPRLVRKYDDYVLGKLYADPSFERGADSLLRYQGRDRARGLAYLVGQLRRRAALGGALLSPAVIKAMTQEAAEALVADTWNTVEQFGVSSKLVEGHESVVRAFQNLGETLGVEDIFELEHGTALAEYGQRVALRQTLRAADDFGRGLPKHKIRPSARRRHVATNILDEDMYPVGGFTSISNRGTIESLLHSELAYMEREERPDLFDIRFSRDELLYYSRDENQFLRRRLSFLFALDASLEQARFKAPALPYQNIVLVLGGLLAVVGKLTEWLGEDALSFEFLILDRKRLAAQEELLTTLFREQLASGEVRVERIYPAALPSRCKEHARRSLCRLLIVSTEPREFASDAALVAQWVQAGTAPRVTIDGEPLSESDAAEPIDRWRDALLGLLHAWID